MICLYIVNEEPKYIGMLGKSIQTLRQNNPNVPIVVYYIQDEKIDSRYIPIPEIVRLVQGANLPTNYETLKEWCQEYKVEIRCRKPPISDEKYASIHRYVLNEVTDEKVLLLDSDTFIFANIENFCELYPNHDFVAALNGHGLVDTVPYCNQNFRAFNSGVVLCQHGVFQEWMKSLPHYCSGLLNGSHALSKWLWERSPDCSGREELAASLFVMDHKISYAYFHVGDVLVMHTTTPLKGMYSPVSKILHTLTPHWHECYRKIFIHSQKRLILKPKLGK